MKKIIIILIIINSISLLYAQSKTYCKSKLSNDALNILTNDDSYKTDLFDDRYKVRLFFHLIHRDDGSGGRTESQVFNNVSIQLENAFNGHNICFSIFGIDHINNTTIYNSDITGDEVSEFDNREDLFVNYGNANAINIFVNDDDDGSTQSALSESFIFGSTHNAIYIGGRINGDDLFTSHALSHEIGHVLGLLHTHETYFCPEYVDGTNCRTCGDLICDTRASPNLNIDPANFRDALNCIYLSIERDLNGDLYNPQTDNIMSYTLVPCMSRFTPQQGERMRALLSFRSELQPIRVPNDVVVTSSFGPGTFYHKAFNTISTSGTVNISAGANVTFVAGTGITLNPGFTAENGCTFNTIFDQVNCNSMSAITASKTNSSLDLSFIEELNNIKNKNASSEIIVYPNPVVDFLQLSSDVESYAIFDSRGKLVQSNDMMENKKLDVSTFPSGLYLLKFKINNSLYNTRFIKE